MCSSSCLTPGAHATYGACLRAKGLQVPTPSTYEVNKKGEADLQAYADARRVGIQPSGIDRASIDRAVRISDTDGVAFQA